MARARLLLGIIALATVVASRSSAQVRPEEFVAEPGPAEQEATRAAYGDGFRVLKTEHFHVISDTSVRYHTVVAGLLEQFYQLVHPRFFTADLKPVRFYLINGGSDYERFVRERGLPNASGFGLYESRSRTLYARRYCPDGRESGVGTLFHEAVHAMIDADFANSRPPRWVNEGFASLFEVGRVIRGQWVYGNPNPWRETPFRAAFEHGEVPSLDALLTTRDDAFDGTKARRDILYNAGRSLFLFVLRSQGERALAGFVHRLREGIEPAEALSAATGLELAEIERGWHASIRQLNFGGDYLNRGSGPGDLAILEEGARLYPGYGNLQVALAMEYLNRGEQSKALLHARRALEDPHLIFRQMAQLVVARAVLSTDATAAARALTTSISHQPWNEHVVGDDYEMLAFMFDRIGDQGRAERVRADLEAIRRLDLR